VLHAACEYRTQKSRQKSPSGHHHTTLSGYIFATKASIDNQKKNLLSSSMSSRCPHNMVKKKKEEETTGQNYNSIGRP